MGVFHKDVTFDDNSWEVLQDGAGKDFLHYHGPVVTGEWPANIIPRHADGRPVQHLPMAFMGYQGETLPPIPEGVVDVSYLAAASNVRKGTNMPASVIVATGEYDGCDKMESFPEIGKNVAMLDNWAANCPQAQGMAHIPASVQSANAAFAGAKQMEGFTGGSGIKYGRGMMIGCENMILPSPDLDPSGDFSDALNGCTTYNKMLEEAGVKAPTIPQQIHDYSKTVEQDLAAEGISVPQDLEGEDTLDSLTR